MEVSLRRLLKILAGGRAAADRRAVAIAQLVELETPSVWLGPIGTQIFVEFAGVARGAGWPAAAKMRHPRHDVGLARHTGLFGEVIDHRGSPLKIRRLIGGLVRATSMAAKRIDATLVV